MNRLLRGVLVAGGIGVAAAIGVKALVRRSRWFEFAGKRVVVTGGSRGLGLVLARRLVDAGARVAICARTEEDLESAAAELRKNGGEVLSIPCDIRERDQVELMVRQVAERWGGVDVLFNVAGVIEVGPLDSMTIEDFHRAMATHCWGPLYAVLATLPHMRQQGWGRIVNVASVGGKRAVPHLLPYDTSKFALVGLSNGLRTELAQENILVTTVCPGLMRTGSPRNANFKSQHRKEYAWFSIGDALPIVSIDVEQAADQILRACQNGDAEILVAHPLNVPMMMQQFAPEWTTEIFAIVNRFLPQMGGIGQQAAKGYESHSAWSPSWLTQLSDQAAVTNNEMRPHGVG